MTKSGLLAYIHQLLVVTLFLIKLGLSTVLSDDYQISPLAELTLHRFVLRSHGLYGRLNDIWLTDPNI